MKSNQLLLFPLFICLINFTIYAQGVTGPIGAKAWMMGGASVSQQDVWAAYNNPAGTIDAKKPQAGLYSEQRFNQSSNKLAALALVVPVKYVSLGMAVDYYGYNLFNQQNLSLSVARLLSKQFSLGVQMAYLATNIEGYGHAGSFLMNAGTQLKVTEKVRIGLVLFNITRARYSQNLADRIPSYAHLGLSYQLSAKVMMQGEADLNLNQNLTLRAGLNYKIHEAVSLALGMCNNPVYYTFGTSFLIKSIKLDIASSFHEVLGFTPHLGISLPLASK